LERDAKVDTALDGYVLTTTGQDVLDRICRSLANGLGHRAWTITGAYGSGKSAFTLFLSHLFGSSGSSLSDQARDVLRQQAPELFGTYFDRRKKQCLVGSGYLPILVSGSSEPIFEKLLRASINTVEQHSSLKQGHGAKKLRKLIEDCERGRAPQPSQFVEAIASISLQLRESGRAQGLLIAIDELGKFLEFAAREPESGDIFVLQQLAEATEGASGLILLTVLHQSFERYAVGLSISSRQEWAKIQGRFEDVAFQESPEQLLNVISKAVYHLPSEETDALRKTALRQAKDALQLELCPSGIRKDEFGDVLVSCAPLHPLTALVLVRLCRKFGQNQRSLFAFLTSKEPDSFSTFLSEARTATDVYRLPMLYDYLSKTLGTGLAVGENATRWAEIDSALQRRSAGSNEELEAIKCIGLLSAIGVQGNIKANAEILAFALGLEPKETQKVLSKLLKASVVVFRKHIGAYALWQGSDVDLEGRFQEARKRLPTSGLLATRLNNQWHPQPIVARRHSYVTGTLRYFAVRFTDANSFWNSLEVPDEADGLILYCLPETDEDHNQLLKLASSPALLERPLILMALPGKVDQMREAIYELDTLEWIEGNTPELSGDPIARRELLSRKVASQGKVEQEVRKLFDPALSLLRKTSWFNAGIEQPLTSSRRLSSLLSDICDRVYAHTPRLRNELLNRRYLSSAAAKARRNLIEGTISKAGEPDLGITGTPAEMSMYQCVFRATNMHRVHDGILGFSEPSSDPALREVWGYIRKFFDDCELRRQSVSELFAQLGKPPFGIKAGIIPVLFAAAVVAHDTEVAFYESDSFVPEMTIEAFERLLRNPERFKIRRYSISGVRREVFAQFGTLLVTGNVSKEQHLISVVRPLYRFITRLPAYTRQTKMISGAAIQIREALFSAREPDALLFEELPKACGFAPFMATEHSAPDVMQFFGVLKAALNELQHAYDDLLLRIQKLLYASYHLTGGDGLRQILKFRADRLRDSAVEPRLKAFLHHVSEEQIDDVPWIEAIGSLLVGKPPKAWTDADCAKYELNLADVVRAFRNLEALVLEKTRQLENGVVPAEIMRISVADVHSRQREAVVVVQAQERDRMAEAMISIEDALTRLGMDENPNLALAALAAVSRKFLEDFDQNSGVQKHTHSDQMGK
jgi:hypothetical protein